MKGIWILAGIILIVIILLSLWLFIGEFGGFAGLLGDEAKDIVNEDNSRFVGTWRSYDTENYSYVFGEEITFYSNGTLYHHSSFLEGATYEVNNGELTIIYDDGHRGTPRECVFSDNDTVLTVTDTDWGKTAVYFKQ